MRVLSLFVIGCSLWVASCGTSSANCVEGTTQVCACVGLGNVGAQTCVAGGTYGACQCPNDDAGGVADAASIDGGLDAGAIDGGPDDAGTDAAAPDAGPVHGHAVLIGAMLWNADESFDRAFANAVFLSERTRPTLRVVEYTEHSAGSGFELHARSVMDSEGTARGRSVTRTLLASAGGLATALADADVLFVPIQLTDESTLRTIGSIWHDTLVSFVASGGVVVVLSCPSAASPGGEYHLVEGASLFTYTSAGNLGTGTVPVEIVAASDPIAAGILSPFPANGRESSGFPMSTGGVQVARSMDGTLRPVIRHIVF
jgi:hypothetical protein